MKRAAATDADSQTSAQRARLTSPAQLGALSPAQRCVPDLVAAAFSFLDLSEALPAAVSCRAWYAAAGREKPRQMQLFNSSPDRLASLLSSRSPLRRHVSELIPPDEFALTPARLQQLQALPALAVLDGTLDTSLQQWTAADWRSALPSWLFELALYLPNSHSLAARQHLIDALPVMQNLYHLNLLPSDPSSADPQLSAPLLLEPLLQLPQLTELTWNIGDLTLPQLAVVKQIESLRYLSSNYGHFSAEQLSFLSEPPHRLAQLEVLNLFQTDVSAAHMAALTRLPGIIRIKHTQSMHLDAFPMLPRLPRLQRLVLNLPVFANCSGADRDMLDSSLRACPQLTEVATEDGECSEAVGERLLRALPHLRKLSIVEASIPSLHFLRHAPSSLTHLELVECSELRPGHVLALGKLVPQLELLGVRTRGALLDELELQALKAPNAIGLPNLRGFIYEVYPDEEEEEEE